MRTAAILALGMALGAAALGMIWAAADGDVALRIFAVRHNDGRVEFGAQQRGADGGWSDLEAPERRFLAPDAPIGERRYSSTVTATVETPSERVARDYAAYLHQAGLNLSDHFEDYFGEPPVGEEAADSPLAVDYAALPVLCIVDPEDAGIDALCDGLASGYAGAVEVLAPASLGALQPEIQARLAMITADPPAPLGGWVATSTETLDAAIRAQRALGIRLPSTHWIELVDRQLADPESLFCVISHGGPESAGLFDLFWGLAGESAYAAAGGLNLNLRAAAYADPGDQAAAVRECIADGAASIAITLPNPDALRAVVDEAQAAGIPILSFNSGVEVAREVGTALHFGLDDRRGGELAGEAFNQRGVTGNVLCIVHEPHNVGLEARCDGFASTYAGETERWRASSQGRLFYELLARVEAGNVDGLLSLSVSTAFQVWLLEQFEVHDLPHASFGYDITSAHRVVNGEMLFVVVDHPELQAYAATALLHMFDRFRIDPGQYFGGAAIVIEPLIVGPEQAQRLIDSLGE
ncbi:MAG: substrate-binding domain-containing protein [Chloroflexota bacterium]|nr:substrate-binding domain-containing protein [Chloroflexota bacterium]